MTPLYVYALTDSPVETWVEDGRRFESVPLEGIFALCERRPASPPISEAELQRQHAIVMRIAETAPAVLPARFGSLVDETELVAIVRQRAETFREALELVRGNAQMTVRIAKRSPALPPSQTLRRTRRSLGGGGQGCPPAAASGRAYLEQRLKAVSRAFPARIDASLEAVRRFVLDERRKVSDAGMVTVYQLVRRGDVDGYKKRLVRVPDMLVTGPWPPFAFVPELWSQRPERSKNE